MKSLSKSEALESPAPEGARHPTFREAFLFWLKLGFMPADKLQAALEE